MTTAARSGLVAVLFTDLVGSTELMSKLGERDFDEVRREHFGVLGRVVVAHGGEDVKNIGDGILAVFPSAGEAVEAAVAMQQTTVRPRGSVPLSMRVGVAVGDATLEDGDVFGAPVVEAARLVGAAEAGQILVTGLVRALAARAEVVFEDVGLLDLKGLPEPVAACRVGWEPLAVSSVPLPSLLTDTGRVFVGRDNELERLGQLWKEAAAGERRVALVAGEPGIGKTRLAAMAARAAHEGGGVVLAGRCDEDLGVPYQPFVEALRHYVVSGGSELRLGRHGGELVRLVPELSERVPGLPSPLRSDPETERYRLFDAVAAWLADVSAEVPVLLVLDDLQWAAKPTLLLLRHVLRSPEAMSLLVVVTYRDTDVGRSHPLSEFLADLRREQGFERLALTGLDVPGVADYLIRASGHDLDEAGEELAQAIWRETEGSPFFVAEVVRHLAESGGVEQRDGRWVVTATVEDLGIPEGVRDVVGRRLSRLSENANQVLACASVAGLEFEPAVVTTAAGFGEDTVLAALEEAVAARLLVEVSGSVPRNRFSHALVRATLYEELTAARRVALHRKVAEAVETLHAQALDDYLPALAHHWFRASAPAADTARAVDYAARAGDRALAQLAHDEAVAYYGQALDLLDAAGAPATDPRRVELIISLGEAQRRAGDPAHRRTLLDGAARAEEAGDAAALGRAALANYRGFFSLSLGVDTERVDVLERAVAAVGRRDSPLRARLLANLADELSYSGQHQRRQQLADEALATGRRLEDPSTLAHVLARRYTSLATTAERHREMLELEEVATRLDDPGLLVSARHRRSLTHLTIGDAGGFTRDLADATRLADELGEPSLRWMAGFVQSNADRIGGRLAAAEERGRQAFDIGDGAGMPDAHPVYIAGNLFWVRYDQGRLDEFLERYERAAARPNPHPEAMAQLGVIYCELDRPDDARPILRDLAADDFATVPGNFYRAFALASRAEVCAVLVDQTCATTLQRLLLPFRWQVATTGAATTGAVDHQLALLSTVLGDFGEADTAFQSAARLHERMGAPTLLARTQLEWARMLLTHRATGAEARAHELVNQALATARDLGLGTIGRRAVALLEQT